MFHRCAYGKIIESMPFPDGKVGNGSQLRELGTVPNFDSWEVYIEVLIFC